MRKLKILTMNWSPRGLFFAIYCSCDRYFSIPDHKERVKCPNCGCTAKLSSLRRDWEESK